MRIIGVALMVMTALCFSGAVAAIGTFSHSRVAANQVELEGSILDLSEQL